MYSFCICFDWLLILLQDEIDKLETEEIIIFVLLARSPPHLNILPVWEDSLTLLSQKLIL